MRKNGWTVEQSLDCVDLRHVFAFYTPILKPDAQFRVTFELDTIVVASFNKKKRLIGLAF